MGKKDSKKKCDDTTFYEKYGWYGIGLYLGLAMILICIPGSMIAAKAGPESKLSMALGVVGFLAIGFTIYMIIKCTKLYYDT
jgi:hypothetical protein